MYYLAKSGQSQLHSYVQHVWKPPLTWPVVLTWPVQTQHWACFWLLGGDMSQIASYRQDREVLRHISYWFGVFFFYIIIIIIIVFYF